MQVLSLQQTTPYRGRFAPSPTGELHFGSLIAALASYLDARHNQGTWLIRIEDVDQSRARPEYTTSIINTLRAHGMQSDEEIRIQSQALFDYEKALNTLSPHLYPCNCSRKKWHKEAPIGKIGAIYPRLCLKNPPNNIKNSALRLKLPEERITFYDRHYQNCHYHLSQELGDPILKRRDQNIAYLLAVVVDDALQGINQIVRGADLLPHTALQIYLQKLLKLPHPQTLHLPLALDDKGRKLSKQNHAQSLNNKHASKNLIDALNFLKQNTKNLKPTLKPSEILEHAIAHWDTKKIPCQKTTSPL